MAFNDHSTPEVRPHNPLPAAAPQPWHDLWASVCLIHPRAAETFAHAYSAGVDPEDLCLVQLQAHKDTIQAMPRLWFGESHLHPCRIFGPCGEVSQ